MNFHKNKIFLLVLVIIIFLVSWKLTQRRTNTLNKIDQENNLQKIVEATTKDYSVIISTIQTKLDDKGIVQCSKFLRTVKTDSSYYSYGNTLRENIALLLGTKSKYIISTINNPFLKIEIFKLSPKSINYNDIALHYIKDAFNITVDSIQRGIVAYELIIEDTVKLNRFLIKEQKANKMNYTNGEYEIEGIEIDKLANNLDGLLTEYIFSKITSDKQYKMKFKPNQDMLKLSNNLAHLGLSVKKSTLMKTFYRVRQTGIE